MTINRFFPDFLKTFMKSTDYEVLPFAFPIDANKTDNMLDSQLLITLSKKLAFKFKLLILADDEYCSTLPNGSWTGLVGKVHREEADLTFGELIITKK